VDRGNLNSRIYGYPSLEAIALCSALLAACVTWVYGFRFECSLFFDLRFDLWFFGIFFVFLTAVLTVSFVIFPLFQKLMWRRTPWAFLHQWQTHLREHTLTLQRVWDFLRIVLIVKIILLIFTTLKQWIPLINPLVYDDALFALDSYLHAGINPALYWKQAVPNRSLDRLIDQFYMSWFYVKILGLAGFIAVARRPLLMRFCSAYCLLWMIGVLCALVLPTLGPVYVWPEWYAGLDAPIAHFLQEDLWIHYREVLRGQGQHSASLGFGIAAFPSLHVAIVALYTFFLYPLSKPLGILMGLYTLGTQFASVYLGWHYAVDGYFGAILAFLLYRICRLETESC
jgi:hypothetical protein